MDITISIADEVAVKLKERAAGSGQTVTAYTAQLVAETLGKRTCTGNRHAQAIY